MSSYRKVTRHIEARSIVRYVTASLGVIRRDFANIINNLEEQLVRVEQAQSVILGDQESSDEYDTLVGDMYSDLVKVLPILINQACRGVEAGMIVQPIVITSKVREAFDGQGLLLETER